MEPPFEFRIIENTFFVDLKYRILHYIDNRIVARIKYCSLAIDNEGNIKSSKFKMKTDANVSVIWSTFYLHN